MSPRGSRGSLDGRGSENPVPRPLSEGLYLEGPRRRSQPETLLPPAPSFFRCGSVLYEAMPFLSGWSSRSRWTLKYSEGETETQFSVLRVTGMGGIPSHPEDAYRPFRVRDERRPCLGEVRERFEAAITSEASDVARTSDGDITFGGHVPW